MATELEVAWAAGLFEGEGCFCILKSRNHHRQYVRVQLGMKDADVVERFAEIVGCGTIRRRPRQRVNWSAISEWSVIASADVKTVIHLLLPHLGERRSEKALEALGVLENVQPAAKNRTHCPKGHPYSGHNVRVEGDGTYAWRRCRACKRDYDATRYLTARQVAA